MSSKGYDTRSPFCIQARYLPMLLSCLWYLLHRFHLDARKKTTPHSCDHQDAIFRSKHLALGCLFALITHLVKMWFSNEHFLSPLCKFLLLKVHMLIGKFLQGGPSSKFTELLVDSHGGYHYYHAKCSSSQRRPRFQLWGYSSQGIHPRLVGGGCAMVAEGAFLLHGNT